MLKVFLDLISKGEMAAIEKMLAGNPELIYARINDIGSTALHLAALTGQIEILKYLVDHGADIDAVDDNENTPIHYAIKSNQIDIIEYLIANGADLLTNDISGKNALAIAIQTENKQTILTLSPHVQEYVLWKGNDIILNFLIKQGTPLAYQNKFGYTLLHSAALPVESDTQLMKCIKLILDNENAVYATKDKKVLSKKDFINLQDDTGMTALHLAFQENKVELIESLVSAGADPAICDNDGRTILHFAVISGNLDCIDIALAMFNKKDQITLLDKPDSNGASPIHEAAAQGNIEMICYLISLGANLSARNNFNYGVIDQAIQNNNLDAVKFLYEQGHRPGEYEDCLFGLNMIAAKGHTQLLKYFIEQGEAVKTDKNIRYNPLMYAAENGKTDCLDLMLSHPNVKYVDNRSGENKLLSKTEFINLCTSNGLTALHIAAAEGHGESLYCLLRHGAQLSQNESGLSPLNILVQRGHENALKFLIEKGVNLFVVNKYNATPLHDVAHTGNLNCMSLLLNHPNAKYIDTQGLNTKILTKKEYVNHCSTAGNTALHLAAKTGNVDTIKLLIQHGADIEIKNNNGDTPLELAKAGNHKSAIDFLTNRLMQSKSDEPKPDTKSEKEEAAFLTNDPYSILGVSKDDSSEIIRKAYYKKMREYHPDKAGKRIPNANEIAKMINWAYKILKDPNERKKWEASQSETENNPTVIFQMPTSGERISESFRRSFEKLETLFKLLPLKHLSKENKMSAFDNLNDLSKNKLFGDERYQHLFLVKDKGIDYPDVYQYIQHLTKESVPLPILNINSKEILTPRIAIDLLLRFLAGEFYGSNLTATQDYLQAQITQLDKYDPSITFYRSIQTIINVTCVEKEYQKVLDALQGIYSFSYQTESNNPELIKLMQNKYFRYMVADAHRYYWKDDTSIVSASLLAKLKSELSGKYVLPWGKILLRIEEQMLKAFKDEENLDAIYECAYLLLDLSKSYLPYATVINSAILAGLCFQYASRKESQSSKAMAAEQIALCIYQNAMSLAYFAGAQVALYASTHIAKYVSEFVYDQSTLDKSIREKFIFQPGDMRMYVHRGSVTDTIEGAIQKSLYLLDMFPFYISQKSTFDLEVTGLFQLGIIRDLLQSLQNDKHLSPDHDRTKIIYQLYQNAVEKWCESETELNERWEEEIKLKLLSIELLLEKDNSNYDEMERLIDQPYIHMERDYEGFLQVNGELWFPDESNIKVYKSFDGFEIDGETGSINLLLTEWHEGDARSLRLFTDHDIAQMLSLGIGGGALSLDHIDQHKKMHPLQMVRYAPDQLKDTEYLKTLFMTDYLLKMFAIGAEISADSPYLTRKIDSLLMTLPDHLRKILDFSSYSDKPNHTAHRFWITTDNIERKQVQKGERITVYYGDVKAIVKTHSLELNAEGTLVDTEADTDVDSLEARFARNITEHYHEIGSYFPEFLRLEQLIKIAGAVRELKDFREQNKLNFHNNALEQEFISMQLSDEPVTNEKFATSTLRAPAIRYEYIDGATEELHRIYGGVDAYPKFTDKVSGSSPGLFKSAQERTTVRAKELIANYKNKQNSNSGNHSTNSNNTLNQSRNYHFEPKPIRSNPCSASSFAKAALKGGYEAMDMLGQVPHGAPSMSGTIASGHRQFERSASYFGRGRGSSDDNPGAEKAGTYLGGAAIGLYQQWKYCRKSKNQQASVATNNTSKSTSSHSKATFQK